MKKNVERIERTVVDEKITWVASDGTVFNDMENCREYEDTCRCKVMTLLENVEAKRFDPTDGFPFPYANEEEHVDVYNLKSRNDVDTIIMYLTFKKEKGELYSTKIKYPSYDDIGELYYIYYGYDDEIFDGNLVINHIKNMNDKFNEVINTFNTITEEKGGGKDGD